MTIQERARLYNESESGTKYPDSQFMVSDRWASATWILGNDYRAITQPDVKPLFGQYPPGYLKRIWPMFPEVRRVIHLFSGSLVLATARPPQEAEVILLDRVQRTPDITLQEAEEPLKTWPEGADIILADPPYSIQDAENYSASLCNKKKVLEQCHDALKPGGTMLWMDQSLPQYAKRNWKWEGVVTMIRSTNHRVRAVFFFQKQ